MISLGIGLTSNCNLHCAHCYRDQNRIYDLTLADVQKVCENLEISSIGFGTGENGLNPEYFQILDYLHSRNIKMTLASNGYTLSITPDEELKYFEDVEFSVDFPDQRRQDAVPRRRQLANGYGGHRALPAAWHPGFDSGGSDEPELYGSGKYCPAGRIIRLQFSR